MKKRFSSASVVRDKLNFAMMGWLVDISKYLTHDFRDEDEEQDLFRRIKERIQLVNDVSRETEKEQRQIDGTKTSDSTVQEWQTELHLDRDR